MITGISELKTLTEHISYKCECRFDDRKCNLNQKWNNDKCWCEYKNPKEHQVSEKNYFWNPAICRCENGKYVGSIIGDSAVIYDEIIDCSNERYFNKNRSNKIQFKKFLHFAILFINYRSIINNYWYLPFKKSIKIKTFITISRHQKIKRN